MKNLIIDIVITWVNGNDPAHQAKRLKYQTSNKENLLEDIGGKERFEASGEIFVCVASILKFAPFVHKIFIVTDEQKPPLDSFIKQYFPNNQIPIEIIDHKILFEGYEKYLPTFNSLSIETMLYRIPGLSENFVYFNDDVFLMTPITQETWFSKEGFPICYAHKFHTSIARFLRYIKRKKNGHKPFGYKDAMLNAADVLSKNYFWHIGHTPFALCKSTFAAYYKNHEHTLQENIKHRFREKTQYNPQVLFYILAEEQKRCLVVNDKHKVLFLKPRKDKTDYMNRKLESAARNPHLLFGCINSLGETTQEEQLIFKSWIKNKLGIDW